MLELFKDIGIPEEKLHPKFKLLKNNEITQYGEREIIEEWTNGFQDRDNKIVTEFQTTFHSVFWELYLFRVFKDAGFTIDFSKNRPDFIIKKPYAINIEAVVSEIKQSGIKEEKRTSDNILSMLEAPHENENFEVFINEAITRYSNAIQSKRKKFRSGYSQCPWIKENVPFVIALSSYSQIDYGKEYHYPILALLYGYYFEPNKSNYRKLNEITKPETNSKIPIGIFNNPDMADISAIIFSCTVTLGKLTSLSKSKGQSSFSTVINIRHDDETSFFLPQVVNQDSPEELSDGLFIFHNPNAKYKISPLVFHGTNAIQVTMENGGLKFKGNCSPLVSRLNLAFPLPELYRDVLFDKIFHGFNPKHRKSIFSVLEIDLKTTPKEITLKDKLTSLPVTIDLSGEDIELINRDKIQEGDSIKAIIKAELDEYRNTTIWRLVFLEKLNG